MALSKCISLSVVNRSGMDFSDAAFHVNETGFHGTPDFPVAVYLDDVTHEYVNWHWHEEFEIGFVTEGSVILGCGNREYQMNRGDIFFISSNVLHSMHNSNSAEGAVFKSIAFHSSIISENTTSVFYSKYLLPILSDSNFRECIITNDHGSYQALLDVLSKAWDLVYSEPSDYEIKVRNELSTLFCILNRFRENINSADRPGTQNYLPEKRVQILLDFIHSHYQDKITLEDLANAASISKTEVFRCFKSIMGLTPVSYINSYRLQSAAHILIETEKSIQEIAENCGFDDNSYFSKMFKRKYHVTPRNYRLRD